MIKTMQISTSIVGGLLLGLGIPDLPNFMLGGVVLLGVSACCLLLEIRLILDKKE